MPEPAPADPGWVTDSGWVTARTGAALTAARYDGRPVAALALRRNPRRAHLLVSELLGKHVPVAAGDVLAAAAELGALARASLDRTPFVVGFAETATGLGHGVARVCSASGGPAPYAHTTRRPVPLGAHTVAFEEEHSHAVDQVLAVLDDALLREPDRPVVLVDDELSSGRTAVNAVRALQQRWPRRQYLLASLLDIRTPEQRAANVAEVAELGAELDSVSLVEGRVHLPPGLAATVAALVAAPPASPSHGGPPVPVGQWSLQVAGPVTGAHGWDAGAELALRAAVDIVAAELELPGTVLVLGDEEFLYAGQLLACALGSQARTSSTTRSPALVVDEPGYPLRTVLLFGSTDDAARPAFAYNVAASGHADRGPAPGFDHIVLVVDRPPAAHVHAGLLRQLAGAARRSVALVVVGQGTTAQVRRTG